MHGLKVYRDDKRRDDNFEDLTPMESYEEGCRQAREAFGPLPKFTYIDIDGNRGGSYDLDGIRDRIRD